MTVGLLVFRVPRALLVAQACRVSREYRETGAYLGQPDPLVRQDLRASRARRDLGDPTGYRERREIRERLVSLDRLGSRVRADLRVSLEGPE